MSPKAVEARKRAAINLRAYQVGAFDDNRQIAPFLMQQQFADDWYALRQQQIQYGDEATLAQIPVRRKRRRRRFLGLKIKPLRLIGKVARVAAPFIPGIGPAAAAAIAAGGTVLVKGKKAKLFKDVGKWAVIGGVGRVAVRKVAPGVFRLAKKAPSLFRRAPRPALPAPPGVPPAPLPEAPTVPEVELPPELQRPKTIAEMAKEVGVQLLPQLLPGAPPPVGVPTTAMELPPGEAPPGEAPPEAPAGEEPPRGPALAGLFGGGGMGPLMLAGAGLFLLSQIAGGGKGRRRPRRRR